MERHLKELISYVPNLLNLKVLDLGSGRGKFVAEVARRSGEVVGLEPFEEYVKISRDLLKDRNLNAEIIKGSGESLPFPDNHFDFVNMAEVIEHVNEPKKVMQEVFRVLRPGGFSYVSVPNRFGLKDQHFNLYFVNWLPRSWSDNFISIFGRHKDYSRPNGLQRLGDMHYFTYGKAREFFNSFKFEVTDIREMKIKNKFKNPRYFLVLNLYKLLRPWYFDSFHLLLSKPNGHKEIKES